MIIDHNFLPYRQLWQGSMNKHNGAFCYSKEIVKNIIPNVKTYRNWITVNVPPHGCDYAVVFIHNNLNPAERYAWLQQYKDLVLVCGVPETVEKVAHIGKAIYLPLSVDVEYLKKFRAKKTKSAAFVGRPIKKFYEGVKLPDGIDYLEDLPRKEMLKEMAKYKTIYAVGRCAIEAKVLGCEVLPYDPRYPDTNRWQVLDNHEAAIMLQKELDKIDYDIRKEQYE